MNRKRAHYLGAAAAWLILAGMPVCSGQDRPAPAVMTKAELAAMSPAQALSRLKEGHERFRAGKLKPRDWNAMVAATAAAQYPFAVIVSCMDSRAPAEVLFDQGIGDIFSLRVAGNIVDTDFLGSLEYAAKVVGSKLIIVLGHSHCGAIKGAIDRVELGNLTSLLVKIDPAIEAAGPPKGTSKDPAYVARVAERNVRLGLKEIRERSRIIREMLEARTIGLVGGMYAIETGKVTFYAD